MKIYKDFTRIIIKWNISIKEKNREERHKAVYEILGLKRLNINNMEMWVGEDSMEKHIKNYIVKESFYSNEIIFRKKYIMKKQKKKLVNIFLK